MRIIRIAYRGSFEFPKGKTPLNPSGWRCPSEITLEVFESVKGKWKVRDLTGREIGPQVWQGLSAISVQNIVKDAFEKQLKPWVPMGNPGDGGGYRELSPGDLTEKHGKLYFLEPEDREAKK